MELKLVPEYTKRDEYRILKSAKKQHQELEERFQMITLFGTDNGYGEDSDNEDMHNFGSKKVGLHYFQPLESVFGYLANWNGRMMKSKI